MSDSLNGLCIQISASVPDGEKQEVYSEIVEKLAVSLFREGATVLHGNHPTILPSLKSAAELFISAGGDHSALTLVWTRKYANKSPDLIEEQLKYAKVHVIPHDPSSNNLDLVPMREWMAERCDAIVAIGGKWYDINKAKAGVPAELIECLSRGKPGFIIAGFGGAIKGFINDSPEILRNLVNGMSEGDNQQLATSADVEEIVAKIISQLKLLPLKRSRHTTTRGRMFRILALDGGGIRGTFTAAVLAQWQEMLQPELAKNFSRNFDLIAGTSTGAILAIGLGLGFSPLDILNFYREQGPKIFPGARDLRHWLKSKHESSTLRYILEQIFNDRGLATSNVRLVIPTVKAKRGESELIVTPHTADRTGFKGISAVDAALASSAAPSFFDDCEITGEVSTQQYLDGGIWANNPVLPAIAEAVRYLKVPIDRLDVPSIGTVGYEPSFSECQKKGKLGWAPKSADLFFAAQEHAAENLADALIGRSKLLRINQQAACEISLDDSKAINDLAERGSSVGRETFVSVRSRFLDGDFAPSWMSQGES